MRLFGGRQAPRRVLVIGLDCASPQLVFDEFRADLPNLSALMQDATWGPLESSIPCITVPAWASMLSGRDPGELGCYGFRNRADYSYDRMITADSTAIRVPRIWDYVSAVGRESVVIGVPQTYPVRPFNGHLVSCFLTPGIVAQFTYPAIFKQEVLRVVPDYAFDVREFRTHNKEHLLTQIIQQTERQHQLVMHCLKNKPWDFFMTVHIGMDRLHHGFWRYHDPRHRLYEPGNPYENAIRDYYRAVDRMVGDMLDMAGDAAVLVVSDHGVKRMDGGIGVNEWLWRNGWLTLRTPPKPGELLAIEQADVNWSQTRAWASGGYYGRIFLNVQDREPEGIIPPAAYEATRDELLAALTAIPGPDGEPLPTQGFKPQDIYRQAGGVPPDLLIYFGDLHWRAVGSLGHGAIHTFENDTGPDDANHDRHGLFILRSPEHRAGRVEGHQLMDIAPTLLALLGLRVPPDLQGRIIV